MKQAADEILREYLRRAIELNDWSEAELARHTKVSQKAVNNFMNRVSDPRLQTCEKLARGLGVELWQVLAGGPALKNGNDVARLLSSYLNSSEEGRSVILHTAEREAKLRNS